MIGPANAAVARYDGVLHAVPNAQVILSPLTTQKAMLSSKVEGMHATFAAIVTAGEAHASKSFVELIEKLRPPRWTGGAAEGTGEEGVQARAHPTLAGAPGDSAAERPGTA